MTPRKSKSFLHGFDDYSIVSLRGSIFSQTSAYYPSYSFDCSSGRYITTDNLPVKVCKKEDPDYSYIRYVSFEPTLCKNHVELLKTARKVYTHPSCKLSRSMMAEKYKKSLNPFLSDAVIIPDPEFRELSIYTCAVFVNDRAKILVMVTMLDNQSINFTDGIPLCNCISCNITTNYNLPYQIQDVLDAKFIYYGDILFVPNSSSYVMDILTSSIPADKIVFESSVQESLGDENNQLDFDSLTSIKDMLGSSDENTVAAGLKSLSMMDWMHYPNSIKFILNRVDKWKWIYNNATSSTSVKYMLSSISNNSARRRWPGDYDQEIYEQDYELFKKLKMHYDNVSQDNLMGEIMYCDFMIVANNMICPNIKKTSI
jgi:hypothetical protein